MYKFSYIWIFWLILLLVSAQVKGAEKLRSGSFLIYDAIDTSLWEINPETFEASLWLDFDSPLLSISPSSFRVDRQSIIYFRVPPLNQRGALPSELVERDIATGLEISILKAQWISLFEMPTADAILVQYSDGQIQNYCVLLFENDECVPASDELIRFLTDDSILWQDKAGYALTREALYYFDLANMSLNPILQDQWLMARTATYHRESNSLYIAGFTEEPEAGCSSTELMRLDLASLVLEQMPFDLPNCISSFDKMLVSPDGRYLQYDTQEVVVIDLQTGELLYRPFWYSDRALWMPDSQSLLFTYYEQINSSGNRISQVNIFTGKINLVYEGTAGFVWLYQVP